MRVERFKLLVFLAVLFFCFFCFLYYYYFASNLVVHGVDVHDYFKLSLNSHDHFIYISYIDAISSGQDVFGLNNNAGISLFYYVISGQWFFGWEVDWAWFSFLVNSVALLLSFFFYVKIHIVLKINKYWSFLFLLNPSLLYFAQLINKDSLTILFLFILIYKAVGKDYLSIFLMLPLLFLVRVQLAIFAIVFLILLVSSRRSFMLFLVYVVTAIAGGVVARYSLVVGEDSLPDGFSRFVYDVNKEYLVGSLLLNPLRVLQFFQALLSSFDFVLEDGSLDVSRLKNIPQVLLVLFFLPKVIGYVFFVRASGGGIALKYGLISYVLVWLINPTINVRYVMLIAPVFILLGVYVRSLRKNYA